MKKVISIWSNEEIFVDDTNKRLMWYNNETKTAMYNAPIVDNGKPTQYYTDYIEDIVIDDIEERAGAAHGNIRWLYATRIIHSDRANDPNREKWKNLIDYIKEHEEEFFLKNGNQRSLQQMKKVKVFN